MAGALYGSRLEATFRKVLKTSPLYDDICNPEDRYNAVSRGLASQYLKRRALSWRQVYDILALH